MKKPNILKILNYSKVQANIEKLLIPMNSTKKMGKKMLNTLFGFCREFRIPSTTWREEKKNEESRNQTF